MRLRFDVVLAAIVLWFAIAPARAQAPASEAGPPSILVSRQLAARAHLSVGDVVTLGSDPAGTRRADFRIAGIYEPTPDPMRFTAARIEARMHLPDLADLVGGAVDPASRETATAINVRLVRPEDRSAFAADVMARAPGVAARSTSRTPNDDPFAVLDRFHVAISAVTMVGGTAFLLALMVIRAEERRETVGILRLVGISRRTLLASVAVEGVMIAALGAVFGVLIAFATEGLVNRIFQARYDTTLVFVRVTPSIAVRSILIAAPLGVIAGVAASWTLLRRSILSIIRR
ncbi:MAG TPA: FtsX-like permease family protein [Vicinamibacterales bacterium]|nr:FtsX-like permease family protein [Vicinamibacterales bacterium]